MRDAFKKAAQKANLFKHEGYSIWRANYGVANSDALVTFLKGYQHCLEVLDAKKDGTVIFASKMRVWSEQYEDMMDAWCKQSPVAGEIWCGSKNPDKLALLAHNFLKPFSKSRREIQQEVKAAVARMGAK